MFNITCNHFYFFKKTTKVAWYLLIFHFDQFLGVHIWSGQRQDGDRALHTVVLSQFTERWRKWRENITSIEVVCYTFALAHAFTPHVPGHLLYALRSVVFIVDVAGYVFEVVHVGTNQHVPQFHKVTVRLVFHCAKKYASLPLLIQSRHANYFNLHSGWIKLNRRGIFEHAYLRRSPRGTAFPSLFVHEPPPLCYCQSQRTGCTPAEGDARKGCYFNPSLLRESCLSMLAHTDRVIHTHKRPLSCSRQLWLYLLRQVKDC